MIDDCLDGKLSYIMKEGNFLPWFATQRNPNAIRTILTGHLENNCPLCGLPFMTGSRGDDKEQHNFAFMGHPSFNINITFQLLQGFEFTILLGESCCFVLRQAVGLSLTHSSLSLCMIFLSFSHSYCLFLSPIYLGGI